MGLINLGQSRTGATRNGASRRNARSFFIAKMTKTKDKEVAPKGFEDMVKALKGKPGVDSPWAIAWAAKNKGEAVGIGTLGQVTRGGASKGKIESLRIRESLGELVEAIEPEVKDGSPTSGKVFSVLLITEGLSANGDNYYGPEAIATCDIFEGASAFIDHPTGEEEKQIPERRVLKKCGWYKNVEAVRLGDGRLASKALLVTDLTPTGTYAAQKCESAIQYQKDFPGSDKVYIGLSINASGEGEDRIIEGDRAVNYVTRLVKTGKESVDIVTIPARGGAILALMESLRESKGGSTMKKIIEGFKAVVTSFKEARDATDAKVAASKLAEAEKNLIAHLTALEAEGEPESYEAMCAQKEGESEDDYKARKEKMRAALGDSDGDEPRGGASGHSAADEIHMKGKGIAGKMLDKESQKEAREAKKLAIKQLIAESKIPEKYAKTLNVDALASATLESARNQIAALKALTESIAADFVEKVGAGHGQHLSEAGSGAGNQDLFANVARK